MFAFQKPDERDQRERDMDRRGKQSWREDGDGKNRRQNNEDDGDNEYRNRKRPRLR